MPLKSQIVKSPIGRARRSARAAAAPLLPAHIDSKDKLAVFLALQSFEDVCAPAWKPSATNARAAFNRIAGGGK